MAHGPPNTDHWPRASEIPRATVERSWMPSCSSLFNLKELCGAAVQEDLFWVFQFFQGSRTVQVVRPCSTNGAVQPFPSQQIPASRAPRKKTSSSATICVHLWKIALFRLPAPKSCARWRSMADQKKAVRVSTGRKAPSGSTITRELDSNRCRWDVAVTSSSSSYKNASAARARPRTRVLRFRKPPWRTSDVRATVRRRFRRPCPRRSRRR